MANNKKPNHRLTSAAHMSSSAEGALKNRGLHRDEDPLDRACGRRGPAGAQYISTPEAAEYLGISESYLNKARHFGTGPDYVRFGRAIRYSRDALDDWAEQRTTTSARDH